MENLNLFVKSIFIDNMIFAYFLGMCSYLAVSKNVKTAFGLGIAVTFVLAITLPVNYLLETYVLKAGALKWLGAEYAQLDLSFLSLIMFIAIIASMVQLVEMFVEKYSPSLLRLLRNIPAADCCKLRHIGRLAIHATTQLPLCYERDRLRDRFWNRLDARHRMLSGHSRKIKLFKHTGSIARYRYHIYHYRTNGYRLHELFRN